MGSFWTFLTHLHSLAGPTVMLLYPLYASVRAIESPSKLDDEQWLAYWILYSFLTLMEMVAEPVLYWIPIWYQIKVVLVAWLVLPQFRGASFIYERFVREQLKKYGAKIGANGVHSSPKKGEEESH
ncbi:HVA22-like protein e [Cocos nucifera]|uniref:HVA22-like protein n=1 Tax=Cocos nucifera TaxID=13894 RepID=A0A8K0MWS7_COCNU|nr:HVA22-like protein e [Cocos nucifera]